MRKLKKAILTGGGRATRLRPLTHTINKHLLPLANKPMIFYAIEKAVEAGVEEIFINTNPGEDQIKKVVGDGGHWGVSITYFEQEGGPQGIAHVVKCAQKFIGDEPFMFYLSDNIVLGSLRPLFANFEKNNVDCQLAFAKVPDPQRFGVPVFGPAGQLIDVVEKPAAPASDFAVTGIYLFGPKVFFDAFTRIKKSARGEYEIASIFSYFLKNNYKVGYSEVTGWWKDTGKPEDLIMANRLLLDEMSVEEFKIEGQADQGSFITGKVQVGMGTTIDKSCRIEGPVIIGENCTLESCQILPYTTIGAGSIIKRARISNSIFLNSGQIDCDLTIDASMVGANVSIIKNGGEGIHRVILGDNTLIQI
ncbi:glucose-1-phosphate thymidylyltransferase [Patescibacteria group bacterium]|nr:MAG: glucose-1-phosphate thymidylyltransferase [Patescibacteria group bacterium]